MTGSRADWGQGRMGEGRAEGAQARNDVESSTDMSIMNGNS